MLHITFHVSTHFDIIKNLGLKLAIKKCERFSE